jgi:hypothetical protein
MTATPPLTLLNDGAKLSDISRAAINNFGLYHELKNKVTQWQQWYLAQKALSAK